MSTVISQSYTYSPSQEQIENRKILTDIKDNLDNLRTAFVGLTAKMDTDNTAQNAAVTSSQLDTNYASTLDPAPVSITA